MADSTHEEELRAILTGDHPGLIGFRKRFRHVPSSPRCKLCAAPFEGVGGALLRHVGFGRFPGNPAICTNCITQWRKEGVGGAEIPVSLLFADVRGSTGIAERMRPAEFRTFLDGFYRIGTEVILRYDGIVDKLVGDEVIGLFFGGVSGPRHAIAAIEAARELVRAVRARRRLAEPGRSRSGRAFTPAKRMSGRPGRRERSTTSLRSATSSTATARLASSAAAGEILVTVAAAETADYETNGLERRNLEVRGRHEPIDVVVIRP